MVPSLLMCSLITKQQRSLDSLYKCRTSVGRKDLDEEKSAGKIILWFLLFREEKESYFDDK